MLPKELIAKARELASEGPTQFQTPPQVLVDLASKKAVELAEKLGADRGIVEVGSLLMDCELGRATNEGRSSEHAGMSAVAAKKLLNGYTEIGSLTQDNVIACVLEHHGVIKFTTLESEICCNADCYKFASVEGFVLALRFMRPMSIEDQIKILRDKLEEKWGALTLDVCKTELAPQYDAIKKLLEQLRF